MPQLPVSSGPQSLLEKAGYSARMSRERQGRIVVSQDDKHRLACLLHAAFLKKGSSFRANIHRERPWPSAELPSILTKDLMQLNAVGRLLGADSGRDGLMLSQKGTKGGVDSVMRIANGEAFIPEPFGLGPSVSAWPGRAALVAADYIKVLAEVIERDAPRSAERTGPEDFNSSHGSSAAALAAPLRLRCCHAPRPPSGRFSLSQLPQKAIRQRFQLYCARDSLGIQPSGVAGSSLCEKDLYERRPHLCSGTVPAMGGLGRYLRISRPVSPPTLHQLIRKMMITPNWPAPVVRATRHFSPRASPGRPEIHRIRVAHSSLVSSAQQRV